MPHGKPKTAKRRPDKNRARLWEVAEIIVFVLATVRCSLLVDEDVTEWTSWALLQAGLPYMFVFTLSKRIGRFVHGAPKAGIAAAVLMVVLHVSLFKEPNLHASFLRGAVATLEATLSNNSENWSVRVLHPPLQFFSMLEGTIIFVGALLLIVVVRKVVTKVRTKAPPEMSVKHKTFEVYDILEPGVQLGGAAIWYIALTYRGGEDIVSALFPALILLSLSSLVGMFTPLARRAGSVAAVVMLVLSMLVAPGSGGHHVGLMLATMAIGLFLFILTLLIGGLMRFFNRGKKVRSLGV